MLSKRKTAFPKADVIFPKRVLTSVLNETHAIARLLARRQSEKYRDSVSLSEAVHTERNWTGRVQPAE